MAKNHKSKPRERDNLPLKTRVIVLTESGYRCAVPTCRNILALDMHHIWEVVTYAVNISDKGKHLIHAWKQGDRIRLRKLMGGPILGGAKKK